MRVEATNRLRIGLSGLALVAMAASGATLFVTPAKGQPPVKECEAKIQRISGFEWRGTGLGYKDSAPSMWQEARIGVRASKGDCTLALVVDDSNYRLAGPGGGLDFTLSNDRDSFAILSDPNASPFKTYLTRNEAFEFTMMLSIQPAQVVRAGAYKASVPVKLYSITESGPLLVDQTVVEVSTLVEPELSVSASGFTGNRTDVNFGSLVDGFSYQTDVQVQSNASVMVRIESEHHGKLEHEQANLGIPYRTYFDGQSVDLSAGSSETWLDLPVGKIEDIELRLEGDPLATPIAGQYTDTMTLVFRAE